MMITDEQIEAAAKAGWDYGLIDVPWEEVSEAMRAAHLSRARDMLEAAERVAWREIETAPKDGTPVDLWCVDKHNGLVDRRPSCWWSLVSEGRHGWCGISERDRKWTPTHWRPLPEPPK